MRQVLAHLIQRKEGISKVKKEGVEELKSIIVI
jgi:hypothetical protein